MVESLLDSTVVMDKQRLQTVTIEVEEETQGREKKQRGERKQKIMMVLNEGGYTHILIESNI